MIAEILMSLIGFVAGCITIYFGYKELTTNYL